jgi:2-dehydropantoate 2-reductase
VWNIPFNALTVLLDATTRRIVDDAGCRELSHAVMLEVVDGANACGVPVSRDFADAMIADTQRMVPYQPSMKLDFDAHRPMEVEAIFGEPVRRMERAGFAAPVIRAMYRMLGFLDKKPGSG